MLLISLTVDSAEHQEIIIPTLHEFKKDVNEHMSSNGWNRECAYALFARGDQKLLSYYGEENVQCMMKVGARYDPKGGLPDAENL